MAVKKIDTAEDFNVEFPRCLPWLIEAYHTTKQQVALEQIIEGLVEREYQLWTTPNAACITAITQWEGERVCCVYLVGGERGKAFREIADGEAAISAYAKQFECKGLLGIGRATWTKFAARFGFQNVKQDGVFSNVYFKELIDGWRTKGNNAKG